MFVSSRKNHRNKYFYVIIFSRLNDELPIPPRPGRLPPKGPRPSLPETPLRAEEEEEEEEGPEVEVSTNLEQKFIDEEGRTKQREGLLGIVAERAEVTVAKTYFVA